MEVRTESDLGIDDAVLCQSGQKVEGGPGKLGLSLKELVGPVKVGPVAPGLGLVVVLPLLGQLLLHEPGPEPLR